MIYGNNYSPGKPFIEFARRFFEALASNDFQSALGELDASERRWSKDVLLTELSRVISDESICSSSGFRRSAEPDVIALEDGNYQLVHAIPVNGKWSAAKARFEFIAKKGGNQFKVRLVGFEL